MIRQRLRSRAPGERRRNPCKPQLLTLRLKGITAGDYLAYVRDPEPQALGMDLRSVTVRGDPLGDTVEALLCWRYSPPDALAAAPIAGLPLSAEVVSVTSRPRRRSSEGDRSASRGAFTDDGASILLDH